jgi:septum formation protein
VSRPLVLASASPRRRELLAALDLGFDVVPVRLDEEAIAFGQATPAAGARAVAEAKMRVVQRRWPDAVVLGADTIVVLDGRVLGKPKDADEARAMLLALRDRTHTVFTAVALGSPDGERTAVVEAEVRMRAYPREAVEQYVASGQGLDKAGGYGIQDEPLRPVELISGCWCNVVGLPLWTSVQLLAEAGCAVPRSPEAAFARCAECPLRR